MDSMPLATAEMEAKSNEGQRLAENIKNSFQLPEQLEALKAANREIESRIIRVGQLANNQQYFFRLESETGVKLLDLRQAQPPRTAPLAAKAGNQPVGFNVSVQGSYAQVMDFLRRLESGIHYCRILTAELNPVDDTVLTGAPRSNATRLTLNLELLGQP
jgi:hypothetical protein